MQARQHIGTLVLGLGNLLLADEGVGVHVAQRMRRMRLPSHVEVVDGGTGGFELIEHCRGRSNIIIVDCLNADAPAGSAVRLLLDEVNLNRLPSFSAHQGGVRELLGFIKTLRPTPKVVIYGIVPAITDQLSMEPSPEVERKLTTIISTILGELNVH